MFGMRVCVKRIIRAVSIAYYIRNIKTDKIKYID